MLSVFGFQKDDWGLLGNPYAWAHWAASSKG